MLTTKTKLSITIDPELASFLEEQAQFTGESKSGLVTMALRDLRKKN